MERWNADHNCRKLYLRQIASMKESVNIPIDKNKMQQELFFRRVIIYCKG